LPSVRDSLIRSVAGTIIGRVADPYGEGVYYLWFSTDTTAVDAERRLGADPALALVGRKYCFGPDD
jgi:hypothetical protein